MIQTKENIDECNNTFSKNNCSYDTNCQNEYSPTYTHLAGLDDSQMGCENHPLNIQNESNAPVPSSQNSEGKELDLKSEKEKELEDCSNPKFKDEAGDDSHNESAISSDLIGKHENSDTYICNEESCKPMAPEGGDEKLDDNQPDVPMSLEDYNTNEPIKYQDDKICENKEIEVPDNQTIDSVQSHKKNAEEILRRLRFIVSDHRLNTKSKTKNLNFFSKSKKIVDKFKAQNVKQAIALEKDNDLFNQGGCELRIPKAQLPKISTNNRRANQSSGKKQEIRREKSTLELREPFITKFKQI